MINKNWKIYQDANDEDRYKGGDFYPVCIEEFYMNDLAYWKNK